MENNVKWTRGELKRRSKDVLHLHYWRLILITFLLSFFLSSGTVVTEFSQSFLEGVEEGYTAGVSEKEDSYDEGSIDDKESKAVEAEVENGKGVVFALIVVLAMIVLVVIIIAVAFIISFFVINPLYVGAMRFYIRSFDTKPQFKELFFAFENRYKNVVVVMLLRDLYTIFWSLLLIVPGIVKAYEYSMIPYLLAENPELTAKEAFAVSKQMMKGQKWNAFVLDLSFLGWQILSILTIGILGIFYVDSYVQLTGAALYRRLKGADCIPENIYYEGMDKDVASGWYKQGWYRSSEGGRIDESSDINSR